jgi:hypothetical protein
MRILSIIRLSLLILVVFILPSVCFGQIDPGCDPDDPACPIDGGVSLLIAAGVGLGAKRAYQSKRAKK